MAEPNSKDRKAIEEKFYKDINEYMQRHIEDYQDWLSPVQSPKKTPKLTPDAENLLLLAEKGPKDLMHWCVAIQHAWSELWWINNLYGSGFIKLRLGKNQIAIQDFKEPGSLLGVKFGEDEWRQYCYAYGAHSLFQCFFRIFPEIDNVDTEAITGLKFENPFLFLHEPKINPQYNIETIQRDTFYNHAQLCDQSPEFNEAWEKLKAGTTFSIRANNFFEKVLPAISLIHSQLTRHTYPVDEKAKTDTFEETIAAIQFFKSIKYDRTRKTKDVVISSIDILGWIIWNIENDWELKAYLDDFIKEYQRPLRKEYTLASAIDAFLNRPLPGKVFIGNEPPIESMEALFEYLYLTFREIYGSNNSKKLFKEFASQNKIRGLGKASSIEAAPKDAGEMALLKPNGKFIPVAGFDIFGDDVQYQSPSGQGEEGVFLVNNAENGVICTECQNGLDFYKKHHRAPASCMISDDNGDMGKAIGVILRWKDSGNSLRPGMVNFLKCYQFSCKEGKYIGDVNDLLKEAAPKEGAPNRAGGMNKKEMKAKTKIVDLKEFDYWKPIYTKSKIEIHFTKSRAPIQLIPQDFGRVSNGQEPKKWKWLMIILGGKKEELNSSQLQDVNDALEIIFDTSIRFFKKNEALPFKVEIERPKFDRRNAAYGEHLEERNSALESADTSIYDPEDDHSI